MAGLDLAARGTGSATARRHPGLLASGLRAAAGAQLVGPGNRRQFAPQLRDMYQTRKRVFVDQLKWQLAVTGDQLEIDDYDRDDTLYLIVADAAGGGTLGSVRLLPTTGPHLLADAFAHLCEAGVPRGDDIWEITRLVTRPGLDRAAAERVREQLSVALVEFAVAEGVRHFTMMTHMAFLPAVMAVGWDCEPLGMPVTCDGVAIAALRISVDAGTLARLRRQWNFGAPLLQRPPSGIGSGGVMAF